MSSFKSRAHWVVWVTLAWVSTAGAGCNGGSSKDPSSESNPDASVANGNDARVDNQPRDGASPTDSGHSNDGGLAADAAGDAGEATVRWYDSREAFRFSLSGALGDAFGAAFAGTPDGIVPPLRKKDPFDGTVAYLDLANAEHTASVVLAVRGNSSLQECEFPKLKFAFDARVDDERDPFLQTREIKIGTHCGEEATINGTIGRLRNQDAAWREEVVYQLARALGIVTLQTRPAIIRYTDTSSEPAFESPLERKAFLLEHIDELARRLGAEALQDPVDCGTDPNAKPDAEAVLRVKFFHAMVGNWDWMLGPPEMHGCGSIWNTEVLVHPDGTLTLVPADFDLSAFAVGSVRDKDTNQFVDVTLERAKVSARGYLEPSLVGESDKAIAAMKAEYLAKQAALRQLIDDSLMDAKGKASGRLLLDGFFAVLAE